MKRIILFAACLCFCTVACQTNLAPETETGTGSLRISLTPAGAPDTKSVTDATGKEDYLKDVQVFIFQTDGALYRREVFPENTATRSLDGVKAGYYDLVAVANAPALTEIQTRSELQQQTVALSHNNPEVGFVMYGETANTVTVRSDNDTPASVTIALERHVSRVRLTTVQNKLPADCGALTIESVFLENGLGNWTLLASDNPSTYVNYAGRKAGRNTSTNTDDFIVAAADAECAALTFKAPQQAVARSLTAAESFNLPFYCYPNRLSLTADHFAGPTAEAVCARLVLRVSYGTPAESWYYPVTLPSMERNTSYDVSFVISGPGTKDPNQRVSNGNLDVEVTITGWGNGNSYQGDF